MAIYFVIFVSISSLFLMNLFVGVISLNYSIADKKAKSKYLTDDQQRWIEMQKFVLNTTPDYAYLKTPEHPLVKFVFNIIKSSAFESFILICIFGNIITMSMAYDGNSLFYENVILFNKKI